MLRLAQTNTFKKQLKLCRRRGWDMTELDFVVTMLQKEQPLPEKYLDHSLKGDRMGQRDCHIRPDWVLIYRIRGDVMVLQLLETGSHSDLSL
ncbi:MAG: type II toxin-antitoxin system YafQ family toxin [Coriobacteriia bacterium]|nr:type II toxin-antitoxin system YafQ family toxin [Coriobacteriia bacterium]